MVHLARVSCIWRSHQALTLDVDTIIVDVGTNTHSKRLLTVVYTNDVHCHIRQMHLMHLRWTPAFVPNAKSVRCRIQLAQDKVASRAMLSASWCVLFAADVRAFFRAVPEFHPTSLLQKPNDFLTLNIRARHMLWASRN